MTPMNRQALLRLLGSNGWQIAATLVPVALDAAHYFYFEKINDWLVGLLQTPSGNSLSIILSIYAAYVFSLWWMKRTEPEVNGKT